MSTDDVREWAHRWRTAAPRLRSIRVEALQHVDVAAFIDSMTGIFAVTLRDRTKRPTSGLVIQQRLFARRTT